MKNKEIEERNKEIALMLGLKPVTGPYKGSFTTTDKTDNHFFNFFVEQLYSGGWYAYPKFDSDWNWLMEAVEFIKSLKETKGNCEGNCYMVTRFNIGINSVLISYENGDLYDSICIGHTDNGKYFKNVGDVDTVKEAVFIAVSDFAKKYNNKEII